MVAGVVNQAIVGKDDALRVTITLHIINVAFLPVAAVFLRQLAFVIAIAVTADGFTRCNLVECAFCLPAQLFGLVFRDIVVRQALIFVDVGSNVLLVGIGSAFADFDFAAIGLDVGRGVLAIVALGCINICCLGCLLIVALGAAKDDSMVSSPTDIMTRIPMKHSTPMMSESMSLPVMKPPNTR